MPKQDQLIRKIVEIVQQDKAVKAAWLSGSFGRDDADEYSDIDIILLVDDGNIDSVFSSLPAKAAQIDKVLYSKILPHSKTLNIITQDWLRFDLTVMSSTQMRNHPGRLKFLFGTADQMTGTEAAVSSIKPEALHEMVNEFIRVLGLMPVVIGRNELVVAQTGTNLLRDLLIRLMVHENDPQPIRGVLSLSKALTPEQMSMIANLPAVSASKEHVMAANKAIAEIFLPRARKLAQKTGATWPENFEKSTLLYLERELGFCISAS